MTENKVTIFNDSILYLMDNLLQKNWNQTDNAASWASFLIDKMQYELDPVQRPDQDLVQLFLWMCDKQNPNSYELKLEFLDSINNLNVFR